MKYEEYKRAINECYAKIHEIDAQYIKSNAIFQVGDLLVLKHSTWWEEEIVLDDHLVTEGGGIIYYAKKFRQDGKLMQLPFQLHTGKLEYCKKVGVYDFEKDKKQYDK